MKPTTANQLRRSALLLALCLGLSGCASEHNGQVQSLGTVTAVNTAEQTVQIKTDAGQSLTVSMAATTDLRDGEGPFRWKTKTTLDQIKAGQYLVVQHSKSSEGKLIADSVYVYNQRPNLRGAPAASPATTSNIASAAGLTAGSSIKSAETFPTNKAVVYIYRPAGGQAWPAKLRANGQVLTTLIYSTSYPYLADPGVIEFTEDGGPMHCTFVLNATAGQTYYLKSTVYTGSYFPIMKPAVKLEQVSPEVGASDIKSCIRREKLDTAK